MTEKPGHSGAIAQSERSGDGTTQALDAIAQAAGRAASGQAGPRGPAPVHLWNPPYCGDIGLEIRADGSWWYQGSMIGRPAMVALFASVLRKDTDGQTYLVTPVEKLLVKVLDAPFLGTDLTGIGEGKNQTLTLTTNIGDSVVIGPDHPLRFETQGATGGLKPYVLVRGRLEARLTRAMTRELFDLALASAGSGEPSDQTSPTCNEPSGEPQVGVWSGGVFWPIPG